MRGEYQSRAINGITTAGSTNVSLPEKAKPCFDTGDGRLRKRDYRVADCPLPWARAIVSQYHYARGASNTATYCHGLFRRVDGRCCGVAWWIPPTRSCAEATTDGDWRKVLALSRLVILPETPKNAATFLLMSSIKLIKQRGNWDCLVTYADTAQGHTGHIYRAAGWTYCGLTAAEEVWLNAGGRMVSRKAGPRTRNREEMLKLGYLPQGRYQKHKFVLKLKHVGRLRPLLAQPKLIEVES